MSLRNIVYCKLITLKIFILPNDSIFLHYGCHVVLRTHEDIVGIADVFDWLLDGDAGKNLPRQLIRLPEDVFLHGES